MLFIENIEFDTENPLFTINQLLYLSITNPHLVNKRCDVQPIKDLVIIKLLIDFLTTNKDNIEFIDVVNIINHFKTLSMDQNYYINNPMPTLHQIHNKFSFIEFKNDIYKKINVNITDVPLIFTNLNILYIIYVFKKEMQKLIKEGAYVKIKSRNHID